MTANTARERNKLRKMQDKLIALIEKQHLSEDLPISEGCPTAADLRKYIYPQYAAEIERITSLLSRR